MANTALQKAKEFTYRLYFQENIEDSSKSVTELTIAQRTSTSLKLKTATYDIGLIAIEFERKVYQPGRISAEIQITALTDTKGNQGTTLSQDDLKDLLLQRRVTLSIEPKDDHSSEMVIAENYYVHEISPQVVRATNGMMMFVKVDIYSMDNLMTLNPYSKAYVVKRLGADILMKESKIFGFEDKALVKVSCDNLQRLTYPQPKDPNAKYEFLQPYLVQYNESFYDFLARTSNRCGEFLMFEGGQLILGLPKKEDVIKIDNYASVSYQNKSSKPLTITPFTRDSAKADAETEYNDSPVDKGENGYPEDVLGEEYTYNSPLNHQNYIFPLVKDKFSSFTRVFEVYDAKSAVTKLSLDIFSSIVANTKDGKKGALKIVEDIVTDYATGALNAKLKSDEVNSKGNKIWIDGYKKASQQSDGTRTVPFSSLAKEGWLTLTYYSDVRTEEEQQEAKIICIDMGANYAPVKLGSMVTVDKVPGKYVVVQITQSDSSKNEAHIFRQYDAKSGKTVNLKQNQVIYAIPVIEGSGSEKDRVMPPVLDKPIIRESGPQTAFIVDSKDPKCQGRVRIAFPWQAVGDPHYKREIEQAKATLKKDEAAYAKALGEENRLKDMLELMKLQNKLLAKLQADMEAEKDPAKQKELFNKKMAEIAAELKTAKARLTVLEEDADATNPNSLVSEIAKLEKEKPAESDAAALAAWETKHQALLKKKILQEDEMGKLTEKVKKFEAYYEDFADYEKSGASSPLDFIKKRQKDREENQMKSLKDGIKKAWELTKKAKDTMDASKERVKNLTKEWGKMLNEVASPWVRVAMPMATADGGTFFKPRKGDEVLVNFDSNNVERPYVAGSLYSCENVDPQEPMVIKSPSGQKISFKIAEDDSDFMQTLTPMLSGIGSLVPALGDKLTLGDDAKKLCGGISMCDEFGMFSVNMSSSNRSVKISSPFGTVGLNAFTGITISAPNGDVCIKGKNVSIEAGNNIRLLSGANVNDDNSAPDDDKANVSEESKKAEIQENTSTKIGRWASKVGSGAAYVGTKIAEGAKNYALGKVSDMIGSLQPVDLRLLRCLCDVFLRPIEGTLLVKSKNYLMLEAGKGSAQVPIEQYSKTWQEFKGVERDAEKEMFYLKTTAYIKRIDQKVGRFCEDYKRLRKEALRQQVSFGIYLDAIWKEGVDKPKLKEVGFKKAQEEFKKNNDQFQGGTVDMSDYKQENLKGQANGSKPIKGANGKKLHNVDEIKAYIVLPAEDFAKACWALHKTALGFTTCFSDDTIKLINKSTLGTTSHESTKWIDEAFKKAIFDSSNGLLKKFQDEWKDKFGDTTSGPKDAFLDPKGKEDDDVFLDATHLKRYMVATFLLELYKSNGNTIPAAAGVAAGGQGKFFKLNYDAVDDTLVNKKWSDVAALGAKDRLSLLKRAASFVGDQLGITEAWSNMFDSDKPKMGWARKVWNGKGGKIIFSDKKGATYTINGENIETWKHASLGNEDNLKSAITDIQ